MSSIYGVVKKFGRTPDIDAADANEEIWDATGAYTGFLAAATAMTISSSSAADTAAGTGARTVTVIGLDTNWRQISQTVTLNGQTGVAIPTSLIRVFRAYVLTAGTGEVNAGDIWIGSGTITTGVPANKYAGILTGLGQTLMAVYSVPAQASEGGLITHWYADIGGATATYAAIALQIKEFGGAWQTKSIRFARDGHAIDERMTWIDENENRQGGVAVGSKSDIRLRIITNGAANTQISGGFDLELLS
jgi:hypothetical protein